MSDKNNRASEKILLVATAALFVILLCVSVVLYFVTHKSERNTFEETCVEIEYAQEDETILRDYVYFAVGDGDKYHVDGCSSVRKDSQRVPVSQKQIDKGNYTPCKKCIG